ncbi:MAG: ATP-dependent endonuclease [gamma proteobacterium symbiont of Ctena orbiculata]|nr:MAG: ATP-dependent endonuclease [gamma proteobacterium symbiont of Ctena orbiculata]
MRITKIQVRNFRLLRDIVIDLEDDLSVIIGKNNCGKTSLLLILDKFLGSGYSKNSFSFDDLNVNLKEEIKSRVSEDNLTVPFPFMGISLKLFIEYDKHDDLSNIGNKVIMDLDPENRVVVLAFEYSITQERFQSLKSEYRAYCDKRKAEEKKQKDIFTFLKEQHTNYFNISWKSLLYDLEAKSENEEVFTDLKKEKIPLDKIICFKWISARRSVSNKDSEKALSTQSSKIYKKLEASNNNPDVIERFKDTLSDTDDELDKVYQALFDEVINDVRVFGGIKAEDSIIKIVSSLQHRELLEENTTVMYGVGATDHTLPESYNGLGYMNLISMIFEIKILLHEFQKEKNEKPSDINLLFIEEPEVHTHPQMQRIFIKNIKTLLQNGVVREDGDNRKLQTMLSTHSAHIVSESDFEDIKYFKRTSEGVLSKNLKELRAEYGEENAYYKFLKQYLTLHRSDLFFADKAIFIEGDTERILLPAIMKKIDQYDRIKEVTEGSAPLLPLLSQNISIVEVGAYSQVFEKFIDFIGVKSLIITDIDSTGMIPDLDENGSVKKNEDDSDKLKRGKCPVESGDQTSNASLKFFYGSDKTLDDFKNLAFEDRILRKSKEEGLSKWVQSPEGHLVCVYQMKEQNGVGQDYWARSFEDAFFHINDQFIADSTFDSDQVFIGDKTFPSINQKKLQKFANSEIDAWDMASAISKKPGFAMEILLCSNTEESTVKDKESGEDVLVSIEFSNWNIPAYIREGLQWLKQD